ncbi:Metalloprotease PmbA [Buchnera aphidicola (Thelaxes suberi)]|uniref:metalloprotease PmbA n=1 Tax=Buchnera aphidicola TaxID=9 RepID=UPI0034648D48
MHKIIYEKPTEKNIVDTIKYILDYKRNQFDHIEAHVQKKQGMYVSVRNLNIENIEFHKDINIFITVYIKNKKGSVTSSDLSMDSINKLLLKAINIASYSTYDKYANIPNYDLVSYFPKKLKTFFNYSLDADYGINLALQSEQSALSYNKKITNSEGSSFSSSVNTIVFGSSAGIIKDYSFTSSSIFSEIIAKDKNGMQRDCYYSLSKDINDLENPQKIGIKSAQRALLKLSPIKLHSTKLPIILTADLSSMVLNEFAKAIYGKNVYSSTTFLLSMMQKQVFPLWLNIIEDPYLKKGIGSHPFDLEGVSSKYQIIVKNGYLNTWLLDHYSANRLNLITTGHCGGISNWIIKVQDTNLNFQRLMNSMSTGLFITELMGSGVNIVTGDFSYGASGFFIQNGEIQHAVSEITISGNLKDMFLNIINISNDINIKNKIQTGSILFEQVHISGI